MDGIRGTPHVRGLEICSEMFEGIVTELVGGCWGWNSQAGGLEEAQRCVDVVKEDMG